MGISKQNFDNHHLLVTEFMQTIVERHSAEDLAKYFTPELHTNVFTGLLLDFCQPNSQYNQNLTRAVITLRRAVSRNDSFHASVSFKILPKTECNAFVVDALRDWLSFKHSSKSNYTKAE